jgi:hypothetical protein
MRRNSTREGIVFSQLALSSCSNRPRFQLEPVPRVRLEGEMVEGTKQLD